MEWQEKRIINDSEKYGVDWFVMSIVISGKFGSFRDVSLLSFRDLFRCHVALDAIGKVQRLNNG